MICPNCGFSGEFNPARARFLVFDLLDSALERNRARRSLVCSNCGLTVTFPFPSEGITFGLCLLLAVAVAGVVCVTIVTLH